MTAHMKLPLIIGGMGKTGSRVAARFEAQGSPYRIASRSSGTYFDWDKPETWAKALESTSSAYVVFYPDLAVPGAPEVIRRFTETAKAAGVEHLVLLSGRGEPEAQLSEAIVMESGLQWNVVRASWFAQNFSESFFLQAIQAGEVVVPFGDVKEPFVDADDIADVVFAAMTGIVPKNQLFEVTGPDLLSFNEAIATIAKAAGRDIRFKQVSMEAYKAGLNQAGIPKAVIELLEYLFTEVLDGRNEKLANGVQQALNRPARSFASYAQGVAATGVWKLAAA